MSSSNRLRPHSEVFELVPVTPGAGGDRSAGSGTPALENTRVKRSAFGKKILDCLTEAVLPIFSTFFTFINVLQLFLMGQFLLTGLGLALFLLPTVLAFCYYLENMAHRDKKVMELGLITALGSVVTKLDTGHVSRKSLFIFPQKFNIN